MASVASEIRSDVHLLMGLPKEKHEATLAALSRKQRVKDAALAKVAEAAARLQPTEEKEEAKPVPTPQHVLPTTSFLDSYGFHLLLYGAGAVVGIVAWRVLRSLIWNVSGKAATEHAVEVAAQLTDAVDTSARSYFTADAWDAVLKHRAAAASVL